MYRECMNEKLVDVNMVYQSVYDYIQSVSNVFFAGKDKMVMSVINMVDGFVMIGEEDKGFSLFQWVLNELLTENESYIQTIQDHLLIKLSFYKCNRIVC